MPVDPHALSKLRSWADLPFLAVNDGSGNRGWEWQQHILPHFKIFKLTRIWERWFLDISCWTELLRSCVWNEAQSRSPRINWLWSKFGSKHPIWEKQWSQVHAALVWIQYQPEIITGTGSNLGEHVKWFYEWLIYASQNMTSMQDPLIFSYHLCRLCQMMPYLLAISLLGSVALKSSKGPGNLHRTRLGDVLRPCCQLCWSLSVQYIPSKLFTSGYAYTRTLSWVLLSGSKAQPFLSWTCLGPLYKTHQNSAQELVSQHSIQRVPNFNDNVVSPESTSTCQQGEFGPSPRPPTSLETQRQVAHLVSAFAIIPTHDFPALKRGPQCLEFVRNHLI